MLTDLHGTRDKYCTACGAKYAATARYCGIDGTALGAGENGAAAPVITPPTTDKMCPKCNSIFPSYALFCPLDAYKLIVSAKNQNRPFDRDNDLGSFREDDHDENVGQTFAGKYRIESLLGEGGMARVYRATHLEIEKPVVIKLMRNQMPTREKDTSIKRFEVEIKVTAKLNHPNLVSVFDGGVIGGRPYLVMEYIKGQSLREFMHGRKNLPFVDAINIISQSLSGLSEAHNQGVVHRDLKPENIMLREEADRPDWVKIVDFGIAHLKQGGHKLTATGVAIGTVDYMSPEYLSDKPIDHRADIYALGVILFELLTGRCPFESDCAEAILAKHLWTTPQPPSAFRSDMIPGCALDIIVEKALEKEPDNRFQSSAEMRKALQAAITNPAG